MKINTSRELTVTLEGKELGNVDSVYYLSSVININGGTKGDIKMRIGLAQTAFNMLKNMGNKGTKIANED